MQRPQPSQSDQEIFRLKELEIFDRVDLKVVDLNNLKQVEDLIKTKQEYFVHLGSQSNVKKALNLKRLQKNQMLISQKILLIQLINFQKILCSFSLPQQQFMKGIKILQ